MGVYGIDFYGVGRFGIDPATVRPDFSVAPFTSTPINYSTLDIRWHNPPSSDCAYLRLVRNPRNLPQDENDGIQVFDVSDFADNPPDAPATLFGDPYDSIVTGSVVHVTDLGLASGFQYYSMFGWSVSEGMWVRCTDLIGLVPINWGYGQRLYSLLPMAYRDRDVVLVDPYNPWSVTSEFGADPPLMRYLQLIGFQFDFIRTELESLMSVNDALNCSGALLPLMMQQFGLVHEPEMGMQQERQLVQNAIHLYKIKGSPRGITEFTSILTSYPSTQLVHHGYNLLMTRNDGVMADSVGTWQVWPPVGSHFPSIAGAATGVTFTWVADLVPPCTNPLETYLSGFPTLQPPYGGVDGNSPSGMRVSATGAGDLYLTTAPIPITDFMSQWYGAGYATFTVQVWSSVARQVKLSLWGDNGSGAAIPIIPEPATGVTETVGRWTKITISGPINPYPSTTPGNPYAQGAASYYWVYPRIRIMGAAANESHYVTLCALWPTTPAKVGIDTPVYDYPRDIKILVQPTASNLLSNTLTTFSRIDPNTSQSVRIGFDGLSNATDPALVLSATNPATGTIVYRPATIEDPTTMLPVNGNAALEVDANAPGATVWFGTVATWSTPPPSPNGWFSAGGNWFPGAQQGPLPRPWFDPVYSWFVVNQNWFGVGSDWINGVWYARPPQPVVRTDTALLPFQVQAGQPFNFSVYAQYMTVQDPSNAWMQMGFRWYFPDGTWVEVVNATNGVQITDQYQRYSIAPDGGPFFLSDPPTQQNPPTGALPVEMYPFVRFPNAQLARFLLNSAMLSPSEQVQPYMDASSQTSASGDFVSDPVTNASYIFPHRTPRIARLNAEMYRWVPMGSTYSITYASGAVTPPLDPTLW